MTVLAPTGARLRDPVGVGAAGKAAEAVTLVLLALLVPRLLGPADYGQFSVALTVVAIGSVALTLGGATLLGRYVPAADPADRAGVAVALSRRLVRNRAPLLAAVAVAAAALVAWDPGRFPPVVTACVVFALVLNVAATLALQADLGMGRALAWCARHPVQNAALIATVVALHAAGDSTLGSGAALAIAVAAVVAFAMGLVAVAPLLRARPAHVDVPDGALRFGGMQAAGGALTQLAQRGGVIAVAVLGGSVAQTGFAALAIGIALAATYAVTQLFTVALPALARRGDTGGGAVLRRMSGILTAAATLGAAVAVLLVGPAVPVVFGSGYAEAAEAFGPALAMVVLAPVNALAVQAAALRTRPEATLWSAAAGAGAFMLVAVLAVPPWGATGATAAVLVGAAVSAVVAIRMLPGAVGARLAAASFGGATAVTALGALT